MHVSRASVGSRVDGQRGVKRKGGSLKDGWEAKEESPQGGHSGDAGVMKG